jgi:Chaperonin 10 Kd subunit
MLPVQYKTVSPVGNRVFVKVDNEEATSAGGILLPTSAQKKPTQGEVVSLGDAQSLKVRRTVPARTMLKFRHSGGFWAAAVSSVQVASAWRTFCHAGLLHKGGCINM